LIFVCALQLVIRTVRVNQEAEKLVDIQPLVYDDDDDGGGGGGGGNSLRRK
jgi:hypothetical protein